VLGLAVVMVSEQAAGLQRSVRTQIANHDEAPVSLLKVSAHLVQTYSNPTQFPLAVAQGGEEVRIHRSRVRPLNRLNQQVPTYLLEGALELRNETHKEITALQITTVFLNAFRERMSMDRQSIASSLAPRQTKRLQWTRGLPHQDVFEIFLVVTAVRFSDGEVWVPSEELILLP